MVISLIVAASRNGVIGRGNEIPWRLPADQAMFKQLTMGHPIIMGRKTHEAIGRPLPGRRNIVISGDQNYQAQDCLVVHSLSEAIQRAEAAEEVFIIGGSAVYEQALPQADRIYLTRVQADIKGDRYFRFDERGWRPISSRQHVKDEKNQYDFVFEVWERK